MKEMAGIIKILKAGTITLPSHISTLMGLLPGDELYTWKDTLNYIHISKTAPEHTAAYIAIIKKDRKIQLPKALLHSLNINKRVDGLLYFDSKRAHMKISPFCEPASPERNNVVYLFR